MSEAEVMQGVFSSIQVVISLFSTFFAMISAYIAGLYFFLNRAPLALKLLAFFLLSIGLLFLGGAAMTQQRLQVGLLAAWAKVSSPAIAVDAVLRNPFPISLPPGWSLYDVGLYAGWLTGLCVYVALDYMTFLYRWKVWLRAATSRS
jgi:drug/metabolite transporter (DMT)-like permease